MMARPRKEIDRDKVVAMLRIQCTEEEICSILDVSHDTLDRWCRREFGKCFAYVSAEKRGEGKASLRRMQWKKAEAGNTTMLIWLGKNMLNQTDKVQSEVSGPAGGPVESNVKIIIEGV